MIAEHWSGTAQRNSAADQVVSGLQSGVGGTYARACWHTNDVTCPNCDPLKRTLEAWKRQLAGVQSGQITQPAVSALHNELLPDGAVRLNGVRYRWSAEANAWTVVL